MKVKMDLKVESVSVRAMKDGWGLTGRNGILSSVTRSLGGWINSSHKAGERPVWPEPSAHGETDRE